MSYTAPFTAVTGAVILASDWNTSGRDDIIYLKDRIDNPPSVRVTHSLAQSLTSGTDTALAFDTQNDVTGAAIHSTSVNNSRLTIPSGQGGRYLIVAYIEFDANATGQRKCAIRLNGATTLAGLALDAAAGSNATRLTVPLLWPAAAGDYFEIVATQNSGGALNVAATPRVGIQRTG